MPTRLVLNQRMSWHMGDSLLFTTTSSGSSTTAISTALIDEDFGGDDDAFAGYWLKATSGNNDTELRRVKRASGYAASTGTLTVTRAFTNTVANAVTMELHRYRPSLKDEALNQSIRHVASLISLPIVDETLIVDNVLLNADFETFATSVFTSWTAVGSPTLTQDTTTVKHGAGAAKVVAGGSNATLGQAPTINIADLFNTSVTFAGWVWTATASKVRLSIDFGNGDTLSDSDTHDGDSSWTFLSVTASVPSNAVRITCNCEIDANTTAYFDTTHLLAGQVYEYTIPSTMLKGPYKVYQQAYGSKPEGPYWPVSKGFLPGRILQLHGTGIHPELTADTTSLDVLGFQEQPITLLASGLAFEMLAAESGLEEVSRLEARGRFLRDAGEAALSLAKNLTPAQGAETVRPSKPTWYWTEDGSTRTLVLPGRRTYGNHKF
jgi:hypothetical protein